MSTYEGMKLPVCVGGFHVVMQYATRVANLSGNGTKYYRMIVIWDLFGAVHYGLVEIFVLTFALEGGDGEMKMFVFFNFY